MQCLLASYPRSGNTWMRALLTACAQPDAPLVLDDLLGHNVLLSQAALASELGEDPTELTIDQLDEARSALLRRHNTRAAGSEPEFVKTHAVNRTLPSGHRFADAHSGHAVYLVRHPFDVAVSYAAFVDTGIDEMIELMLRSSALIDRPAEARPARLPELLSSWAAHVDSWTVEPPIPTTLVRYEDLMADPLQQLRRVVDAVGIDCDDGVLARAIDQCSFARLRHLETVQGIAFKPSSADWFFRAGVVGEGGRVPPRARARFLREAGKVMARLGYGEI